MAEPCLITRAHPNGLFELVLNRPEALNALNHDLLLALEQAFEKAKTDPQIKALLLHGEGKAFCAGADIHQLARLDAQSGYAFAKTGQKVFSALENLGKPSVAAIAGFALGGGCELAMAATLRIAAETAKFGQPEIKLGVIPGFGGTQRLARLVGKGRALDLCLSARIISADEAYQIGLVTRLSGTVPLLEAAKALMEDLLSKPPQALKSMISAIDHGMDLSLLEGLDLEAQQFALCCGTQDKKEGVAAFLEKREARFGEN